MLHGFQVFSRACLSRPPSFAADTGDTERRVGSRVRARDPSLSNKTHGKRIKGAKKEPATRTRRGPRCFFPSSAPQHRLLIFKSPAIAWCGFKSWGAILPDDDSADVNGILIMPSATSETSPPRLLLFAAAGRAVKCGPDRSERRIRSSDPASQPAALIIKPAATTWLRLSGFMSGRFPSAFSGAENPPHSHPSRRGDSGITTLALGLSFVRSAHVKEPLL